MKNIILLSDGTGNGASKKVQTNVWKLYNALDFHTDTQIAYYDDGVGSQEFLPFKILGGIFGFGLKENVLELYKFLCRNYKEYEDGSSDKIYLFGFSRGAFTVRTLAGLIAKCGLYTNYKDEEDLNKKAKKNYMFFRTEFHNKSLSGLYTQFINATYNQEDMISTDIEFIGVWDTVDAYGFPIDEMAQFWDRFIFPIYFPDYKLSDKVKRASQALSIDDERHTFHPLLWDESKEIDSKRIEQVWFSGVHADIGGGYPMNSLSLISLDWMIDRVEFKSDSRVNGLKFISHIRSEIYSHSNYNGKQHDSRSGVRAYYRYKPRIILELCKDKSIIPKIHFSVLERIKKNAVTYAPVGIPSIYEVTQTDKGIALPYESKEEATNRANKILDALEIINLRKRLYKAFVSTTILFITSIFILLFNTQNRETNIFYKLIDLWHQFLLQSPLVSILLFVIIFIIMFVLKNRWWYETQVKSMNGWSVLKGRG